MSDDFVTALCTELELRKDYINNDIVETIYFGGGTPSQLSVSQFNTIFEVIDRHYKLSDMPEITIEANPDDLSADYIRGLKSLPFNRMSIGIQTFHDKLLKSLNRRHTSRQAYDAVLRAKNYGFDNISIDLMYGLPSESLQEWEEDLKLAIELDPEHISAYHLIYEKGTVMYNYLEKGYIKEVDEDDSLLFFEKIIELLSTHGYEHYEISNFAKKSKYSKHNTSYWLGKTYLGCGPSAHSYNTQTRDYNSVNLSTYIEELRGGNACFTTEKLDAQVQYNDYIITRLRTKWGLSLKDVKNIFGYKLHDYALNMAQKYIKNGELILDSDHLKLSKQGIFVSDSVMSDLLYV